MSTRNKRTSEIVSGETGAAVQATLIAFGLGAPFATYAIASSTLHQDTKVALLVAISVVYLAICIWTFKQMKQARKGLLEASFQAPPFAPISELEQKLLALEDAREFFGTSLKPADMFRLVANRAQEIVPFATCMLLIKDVDSGMLQIIQAFGIRADQFENTSISSDESLAGLSFLSGELETSGEMENDNKVFPSGSLDGFGSTAAIPLMHEDNCFAVFQLFFNGSEALTEDTREKLSAIAERISPLFLGSMAFERSLSNALTDPLTKLPNERAFYMVLENQLAESHRFRDERPLTVLAVDIKNFDDLNRDHGHAVGDRVLSFAAEKISSQLRKMDFLARSMNDEFLVVLPKATERTAIEITGRIQACLSNAPFQISEEDQVKVWLNFGIATFWKDGETSHQLIQAAFTRKQQVKSEDPGNIVWFPKEYLN
jgi:diguanylate cyclase (GGDEF)-like protein